MLSSDGPSHGVVSALAQWITLSFLNEEIMGPILDKHAVLGEWRGNLSYQICKAQRQKVPFCDLE